MPALLGPLTLLDILRLPIPADPIYLRFFGGAATAWGVAYWLAHKDPVQHVAIVKAAIVDNVLPTAIVILVGVTNGISSIFMWLSALITGLFELSFFIFMPREG